MAAVSTAKATAWGDILRAWSQQWLPLPVLWEEYQLELLPCHRTQKLNSAVEDSGTRQCKGSAPQKNAPGGAMLSKCFWKKSPAGAWEEALQGLTRGTPVRKPQKTVKTERQLKNPRK